MTWTYFGNGLYTCLSTDTKVTTGITTGSGLIELDTNKQFYFTGGTWNELAGGGGGGSGDVTGAANVGTGEGLVFRDEVGGVLNLKRLLAGTNVTITNGANDITIASSGSAGTVSYPYTYFIYKSGSTYYAVDSANTVTSNAELTPLLSGLITAISPAGTPTLFQFDRGDFTMNSQLAVPSSRVGNITFNGQGMGKTRILIGSGFNDDPTGTTAIFFGTYGTPLTANVGTLTANANARSLTVTMSTTDAAKFTVGDYILMRSERTFLDPPSLTGASKQGEVHKIAAVNTGTGVVTLDVPLFDTYTTANTSTIVKLVNVLKNMTLSNMTIQKDAAMTNAGISWVFGVYNDNFLVENVEAIDTVAQYDGGICLIACFNSRVRGCRLIQNPSNPHNLQYGISLKGVCQNVVISDCQSFGQWRHAFEVAGGNGNVGINYGVPRNIICDNCVAQGSLVSAFDTHADGELVLFNNCQVLGANTGYGFLIRTLKSKLTNCITNSALERGFVINESAHYTELVNCHARNCVSHGIEIDTDVKHVKILGGSFCDGGARGISVKSGATHAKITDTICSGNATDGIFAAANADYLTISNVTAINNLNAGIVLNDVDNLIISNCTVANNTNDGIYLSSPTRTLTNLNISGNNLAAQVASKLTLPAGLAGSNIIISNNMGYTGNKNYNTVEFRNATINTTDNTLTATSQATGDILVNNGTKFVRQAKGADGTFLGVQSGTVGYYTPSSGSGSTVNHLNPSAFPLSGRHTYYHTPNSDQTGQGLLSNMSRDITSTTLPTSAADADGSHIVMSMSATSGHRVTYFIPGQFARGDKNPAMWGKLKTASGSKRIFVGFSSGAITTASDNFLNLLSGFGIAYVPAVSTTNWYVYTNDGAGAGTRTVLGTFAANTVASYYVKYDSANSRIEFSFNGGAVNTTSVTTDLPVLTTAHRFNIRAENTSATAQAVNSYYQYIEVDQ